MEKVESQEKSENDIKTPLKNMISELKALNEMYRELFEEATKRGIEDSFTATKEWSTEKITAAQDKLEEIGKKVSKNVVKAGQKVKNAGKVALGLGVLGVELTIKGAKSLRDKVYKPAKESIKTFARNKANGFQGYVKGKVDDISQNLDEDIAQKNSERIKSAVGNVSSKAEDIGSIRTVANAAKALGTVGRISAIKGARTVKNAIYTKPKNTIVKFMQSKANKFQGYVKGKVDGVSQNLDEDISQKNAERIEKAGKNVSSKVEEIGTIRTVANAAKALGAVGRIRTIKGVKTVGKGVKQKFVDANNAILGFQMGAKKELRKKAKEVKKNASSYVSYKKGEIDVVVSDSKEYIDYARAEVEGKVEDIKKGISDKLEDAKEFITDKKESIIETKNEVKANALDAAYRFEQRKNTTLSAILTFGGSKAKTLLEKIGKAIQSKQEKLELSNDEIDKKRAQQQSSKDVQTME